MHLKQNSATRVALVSLLLLVLVLPFVETADAQVISIHWGVAVKPATPSTIMHTSVGQNFSVSFQAIWTTATGEFLEEAVENANVTVEVKTGHGDSVENVTQTTNATGYVTFNYSFPVPVILAFTPTRTVLQDEKELNGTVYGFQSESVTVYVDTFDVALVSSSTETLGLTEVAVNVTYLLVPEEGLALSSSFNSSQQEVISKIAHGVNVTINGFKAEETAVDGVYTASVSTWLPTAYVIVEVSQEGWTPTHKGFSFTHKSNGTIWTPAIILCSVCAAVLLIFYFVWHRKSKDIVVFSKANFSISGGVLLAIASFISLYWGVVGFDSTLHWGVVGTLHGFYWTLLAVAGIGSFACGLVGSIFSLKRKNQALTIFTVCAPLIVNEVAVKAAFDVYNLATPWVIIALSLAIAVISGILVSNSDKQSASPH